MGNFDKFPEDCNQETEIKELSKEYMFCEAHTEKHE